jgi:hypothetical protein
MRRPIFPLSLIRALALAGAALVLAAAALAAPTDRKEILLRGVVCDPQGRPLSGARVSTSGALETAMITGESGRYSLVIPTGSVADMRRVPFLIRLEARRGGKRIPLAGGLDHLELRVGAARDTSAELEVTSNEPRVAHEAQAVFAAPGEATVLIELDFGGTARRMAAREPIATGAEQAPVTTPAPPATKPVTKPAAPPAAAAPKPAPVVQRAPAPIARATPPQPKPDTVASPAPATITPPIVQAAPPPRPAPVAKVAPATPKPAPTPHTVPSPEQPIPTVPRTEPPSAARAGPGGLKRVEPFPITTVHRTWRDTLSVANSDSCGCRIKGTIELQFDRLLSAPLQLVVSVRGMPSIRDTVELFMGSPRAFALDPVPCGVRSLDVQALAHRPFRVVTRTAVENIGCAENALRQPRIIIAPD